MTTRLLGPDRSPWHPPPGHARKIAPRGGALSDRYDPGLGGRFDYRERNERNFRAEANEDRLRQQLHVRDEDERDARDIDTRRDRWRQTDGGKW